MKKRLWALTDHVCRRCMGRVLASSGEGGTLVYRCSNCGAEGATEAESVCCCGMRTREVVKNGVVVQMSRPVGLRCVPNPAPSAQFPSEIVAEARE